jgi:two-component system, OmpR family, phosphate regulon sensor histidine kinase PhoR
MGGDRPSLFDAVLRNKLPLGAAALVFAALAVLGLLSIVQALAGFAVITAAQLVAASGHAAGTREEPQQLPPALAAADPLLDALIAAIPDPAIAVDRDGRVLAVNPPATGLAPALRRGEPASIALRVPELVAAIGTASATGEAQRVEFAQRIPVGRWYEASVVPVGFDHGSSKGSAFVLVTFRDLTALRRADEMRADFVANASHELRTPLAAVSGFIETLQGPARDDAAARERFLPIMQAQARRMARLIDDLLSLSRIERNAHRRPDTPVDVVPLLRQVIEGLETLARDRGIAMALTAPEQPLVVRGDRDELIRAFENLVENALKYGASGKRVDIAVAAAEVPGGTPEVRIAVRDYGPGIAPEHLPRLTERFYRVDVAESRAQGGTGLGLALVKHILNRHGGRLSIDSTPGAGATFTTHLPMSGHSAG